MCLAVPMTIQSLSGDNAVVERNGITTDIKVTLVPDARVGDRVLVHAGFAIEKLDTDEANRIDAVWQEYSQSLEEK